MKVLSNKKKQMLLEETVDYLYENKLFDDVNIYIGGRKYSDCGKQDELKKTTNGSKYYDRGECDVTSIVEYSNPKTLTMTFEGILYDMIDMNGIPEGLEAVFEKYGLYAEQGYAWSLALYPINF